MLANYVSGPDFNLKVKKSLWTSLTIIGVPAAVVLVIPDVGSLLVFTAYFIALFREGLSGWFFGVGGVLAAVFLTALAIDPIYIIIGIALIYGIIILFNSYKIHWDIYAVVYFAGSFILLCGLAYGSPKILEKMPKHQRERIEVLYKGEKAFRDTSGYNLLYSKTAIGSGGFFGKGYKEGSVTQG